MNIIRRAILAIAMIAGLSPVFAQAPGPVPALPDTERRTSYSISASTCACAVGFQLYGDSTDVANWLVVAVNGIEMPQSGNWSISSPSGQIGTLARPITDAVLTFATAQTGTIQIVGAQRPRRLTEVAENRGVAARDFNQFANTVTAELRELWDRFLRTPRVPPGETTPVLPPLASRANMGVCFDANGYFQPCVGTPGSISAGAGITFTGTNPTSISSQTYTGGSGITIGGGNPATISISASTGVQVIPSRATATTLDLHLQSVVQTGGYAVGGDGGDAIFKNVGAAPFTDTNISTFTVVGGSGYVNGTYLNVGFGGGSGVGCGGAAVVSGGAVISVNFDNPCTGYAVGDVLTALNSQLGGSGSGFSMTVTAITPALGSFIDSVGTHFQIVTGSGGFPNVRQFGAKQDYNGVDAAATNDLASFNSAIDFVYHPYSGSAANVNGGTLIVPRGASLLCGGVFQTLFIPQGVQLRGAGVLGGTTLKQCTAQGAGTHFVTLCGIFSFRGQIGCKISDLALISDGPSSGSVAAIYSSVGQQFPLVERVWIQPGLRGCLYYEKGTGGAANAIFSDIDCEGDPASPNSRVVIAANVGSTQVKLTNWVIEASGVYTGTGIAVLGGNVIIETVNFENINTAITVANILPTTIKNITSGPACTTIVSLTSGNPNGVTVVENLTGGGCTTTVSNNHSGGSNLTGNVMASRVFSP